MGVIKELIQLYCRRRFAWLFFSLLGTMIAAPVLSALGLSARFMEVFLAVNILAAILITLFSFGSYVSIGLLVLVLGARGGEAVFGGGPLHTTSQGAGALACLVSVYVMFRYVLSEGSVSSERIFAALDVYLMVGILCGLVFGIFEGIWPGSFSVQGSSLAASRKIQLGHTIYFSFVTLGTLGYGDMIPIGGPARALAVTEAILGQMYLVVIVARLVSMYQGSSGLTAQPDRDQFPGMQG